MSAAIRSGRAKERAQQPPPIHFTSRRKSCQNCADAKARCTLQRPICSRCQTKGLECQYFISDSGSVSATSSSDNSFSTVEHPPCPQPGPQVAVTNVECPSTPGLTPESGRIASRWLDAFIPPLGKTLKNITSQTARYMARILKSYAKVLVKDDVALPPIIHPLQSTSPQPPLANCRSILRMWDTRAPGSESMVRETVQREMSRIFEEHGTYDHVTLLSACQAYLLYSIHLFLSPDALSPPMIDTSTMINLQELASAMSLTVLSSAENPPHRTRPSWESWILAEAKIRTLYATYMFDNVFNFFQNTPSYSATELSKLPAPSSKALWAANGRKEWEAEYERYIAEWPSDIPRIEDLWPHEMEAVTKERRERTDRWVESVDEFGMFLFSACVMTYDS
ncbi:hypothetical protein B0H11DRAFT_2173247 [Mycena galericulata]|nr:hypothetical protein B0H11DRAFT_2173247 [Mycena galericulata]